MKKDYTLLLSEGCDYSTVLIVDGDGTAAFSTNVTDGSAIINLPKGLSGTYELHIIRNNVTFIGTIVI